MSTITLNIRQIKEALPLSNNGYINDILNKNILTIVNYSPSNKFCFLLEFKTNIKPSVLQKALIRKETTTNLLYHNLLKSCLNSEYHVLYTERLPVVYKIYNNRLYALIVYKNNKRSMIMPYVDNYKTELYNTYREACINNYYEDIQYSYSTSVYSKELVALFMDNFGKNLLKFSGSKELGFLIVDFPERSEIAELSDDLFKLIKEDKNDRYLNENIPVSEFINSYTNELYDNLNNSIDVVFNPESGYDTEVNDFSSLLEYKRDFTFFKNQKNIINALYRHFKKEKTGFLVSQPGTGKTSMAISTATLSSGKNVFILCPAHLVKKWLIDITLLAPNAKVWECTSVEDYINRIEPEISKNDSRNFIIITPNLIRQNYIEAPSINWDVFKHHNTLRQRGMYANTCVSPREHGLVNLYEYYHTINRSKPYNSKMYNSFRIRTNASKVTCNKNFIMKHVGNETLCEIRYNNGNQFVEEEKSCDGFVSLDYYLKRKSSHNIDFFIIDELHEFLGNSKQSRGAQRIASCANKVLGLTGSLFNGYVENIYNMLYFYCPSKLLNKDNKKSIMSKSDFIDRYGKREMILTIERNQEILDRMVRIDKISLRGDSRVAIEGLYSFSENEGPYQNNFILNGACRTKYIPGINPLLFAEKLSDICIFMSMDDISSELPEFNEAVIDCKMNDSNMAEYNRIIDEIKSSSVSGLERYHQIRKTSAWANNPSYIEDKYIKYRTTENEENGKLDELVKIINHHNNECVLVYTYYDEMNDINSKVYNHLSAMGINVAIMNKSVAASKRIEWFSKQKEKGVRVVICNPRMVDTGLDLLDFTTIVFYEVDTDFFTIKQASRRSYRLNQKNNVSVYYLYYGGTSQETIIKYLAEKIKSVKALEGDFDDEGLSQLVGRSNLIESIYKDMLSKEGLDDDGGIVKNKYADKVEHILDTEGYKLARISFCKKPLRKLRISGADKLGAVREIYINNLNKKYYEESVKSFMSM